MAPLVVQLLPLSLLILGSARPAVGWATQGYQPPVYYPRAGQGAAVAPFFFGRFCGPGQPAALRHFLRQCWVGNAHALSQFSPLLVRAGQGCPPAALLLCKASGARPLASASCLFWAASASCLFWAVPPGTVAELGRARTPFAPWLGWVRPKLGREGSGCARRTPLGSWLAAVATAAAPSSRLLLLPLHWFLHTVTITIARGIATTRINKKQPTVALSSTEAEYQAACAAKYTMSDQGHRLKLTFIKTLLRTTGLSGDALTEAMSNYMEMDDADLDSSIEFLGRFSLPVTPDSQISGRQSRRHHRQSSMPPDRSNRETSPQPPVLPSVPPSPLMRTCTGSLGVTCDILLDGAILQLGAGIALKRRMGDLCSSYLKQVHIPWDSDQHEDDKKYVNTLETEYGTGWSHKWMVKQMCKLMSHRRNAAR
ncbi:hypothetical protein L7F22_021929 [Adiantum nelumboides]|nr:hypothetical protein [Adiantum nelumboides]